MTGTAARLGSPERYVPSLRALHWLTALLIAGMFVVGLWLKYALPQSASLRHLLFTLHESTGVTIWVLVLIRIAVRLTTGAPRLPADTPGGIRLLATANQVGLYVLLFLMPVMGFLDANSAGVQLVWYEAVPVPSAIGKQPDAIHHQLASAHWWGALVLFLLLVLHVFGALYHATIRRDGVFHHMA
jgi:cytochrome b561